MKTIYSATQFKNLIKDRMISTINESSSHKILCVQRDVFEIGELIHSIGEARVELSKELKENPYLIQNQIDSPNYKFFNEVQDGIISGQTLMSDKKDILFLPSQGYGILHYSEWGDKLEDILKRNYKRSQAWTTRKVDGGRLSKGYMQIICNVTYDNSNPPLPEIFEYQGPF